MKNVGTCFLLLAVVAGTVFPQGVAIAGRVTDANGNPLSNTLVRMGVGMLYASTNAYGYYALGAGVVNAIQSDNAVRGNAFPQPYLAAGKVLFSVPQSGMPVRISIYDLSGRFVKDIMNNHLAKGNYSAFVDNRSLSNQYYLLRLAINGVSHVMKLPSVMRDSPGTIAQSDSRAEVRLEKLAAVVDTLHATEPGYSLGVMPIQALTGTYNFQLTKTSTWNGDTAGFWGDTSKVKKAAGRILFTILNRTNGAYADSQIYWALGDNGTPNRLSDSSTIDLTTNASGRVYIMVGYKPTLPTYRPQTNVWDFEEHTCGNGVYNGNLTRVDAFGTPMSMRLHCSDGYDIVRGEDYHVFYQPRQSIFDEFTNEVPFQFTACGVLQAPCRIPNPGATPQFSTGGLYAHYWDAYAASVGVTAGPYLNGIASPQISAGMHRHVMQLSAADQQLDKNYYQAAPCNFYSYFLHRRAIDRHQYGFPYDDCYGWSSYISHGNAQWLLIAVGY
jgi:hypothetical protein